MFGFGLLRRETPAIEGQGVRLRFPRASDWREWAALRGESAAFLKPWEPQWAADELERGAWHRRLRRYRRDLEDGCAVTFLIFEKEADLMVGGIGIGNIRYGVSQSGQIGYWMGERHAGRGHMQDAVGAVLRFAFATMKLHRVEAACIPDNARSVRVLEKAGFTREGLLRSYLRIDGEWRDHYLYALTAEDHRGLGKAFPGEV